jgi:HAD superfamily hydrolase (TIGR01509 family)
MARPPAFIYFDMGNVLLNFDHRRGARQMAAVANLSPEKVWEVVFEGSLLTDYESGRIDAKQFHESFCAATSSRPERAAFEHAACAIFDCNAPMLPLVVQLSAAGHRLGVLSNTNAGHWDYCTNRFRIMQGTFEQAVLSFEERVMKPDPEIFRIAAERAGVPPAEIFYVDDCAEHVASAGQVGFDAMVYSGAAEVGRALLTRGVRSNY